MVHSDARPAAYQLFRIHGEEEFKASLSELEGLFPGIAKLDGCTQHPNQHAKGDALIHTAKVFAESRKLLGGWSLEDQLVLLAAAACHDIAKPETWADTGEKITFVGHAKLAAQRCPEFGRLLGFGPAETESLEWVVRHHMDAHVMETWSEKKRLAIYRHPAFKALVALQEADARATWRSADGSEHAPVLRGFFEADSARLLSEARREVELSELRKQLTNALKAEGHKPGPLFGAVAAAVLTWVGDRQVTDSLRKEAIAYGISFAASQKQQT